MTTEPPIEPNTVDDVAKSLAEYLPITRGVVVFAIDLGGTGRITLGGLVTVTEVQRMIYILETLVANQGQLNQLASMEAQGSA